MMTPEQRSEWLRGIAQPLWNRRAGFPPDLSVSNIAFREAQTSWTAGNLVASVLSAYAACEIFLAERCALYWAMAHGASTTLDGDEMVAIMEDGHRRTKHMRIDKLIAELAMVGQSLAPDLAERLKQLGRYKNDLAHFRPVAR